MIVSVGCDHGGYDLKEKIKSYLEGKSITVIDEGTYSTESCDYPIFAEKVALDVVKGKAEYGIVCCTTAEGICIASNKVKGIRCGIGFHDDATKGLRAHNNGNMIAFSSSSADLLKEKCEKALTEKNIADDVH